MEKNMHKKLAEQLVRGARETVKLRYGRGFSILSGDTQREVLAGIALSSIGTVEDLPSMNFPGLIESVLRIIHKSN